MNLLLWHNTLATDVSAEAYVAIAIDDRIAWSTTVPIPSAAASYAPSWRANESAATGSVVQFHIHNHGAKAWRLGDLTVTPED